MADTYNLPSCLQYPDALGDTVVKVILSDYLKILGNKACSHGSSLDQHQNLLTSLAQRVLSIEGKTTQQYTLPKLYPQGIASPNIALDLDTFTALLEQLFVQQRSALGTTNDIFETNVLLQGFNNGKALGTSGGNLSALPNWTSQVTTLTDLIGNLTVIAVDLRSAVQNMKLSCCTGSCNSVEIVVQTTYSARILTFFFTGSIPEELVNAETGGCLFTIEDQSGNFITKRVDIKGNLNAGGIGVDLTGSPLNFADDLEVSGVYSLKNDDTGTLCQKYLETYVTNTAVCPSLTLSSSFTSISYSFLHVEGSLSYMVQLYTTANVMIASYTITVSAPMTVNGIFSDLDEGTDYKVRIQMTTTETTRLCPFALTSTLPTVCPAPNGVVAVIEE